MRKLICHILLIIMMLSGLSACGMPGWGDYSDQVYRKMTPRSMRMQYFSNNPTPYNQSRFDEADPKDIKRQLRNGTRGVGEEYRMKEDKRKKKTTDSEDSYGRGFHDGCRVFLSVVGAGAYRMMDHKFDSERMLEDPWYLRGFQDASSFCTFRTDWEIH